MGYPIFTTNPMGCGKKTKQEHRFTHDAGSLKLFPGVFLFLYCNLRSFLFGEPHHAECLPPGIRRLIPKTNRLGTTRINQHNQKHKHHKVVQGCSPELFQVGLYRPQ